MHRRSIHVQGRSPFNRKFMRSLYLSGFSTRFQALSRAHGQVTYVLLTRSPLTSGKASFPFGPFDLHVLGMPPAFILSQDQTLHLILAHDVIWHRLFLLSRIDVSFLVSSILFGFQRSLFLHRFACLIILPQLGGLCKLFFQALFYQIRSPLAPVYISKYPPSMSNTFFTFFLYFLNIHYLLRFFVNLAFIRLSKNVFC